ncbi:MAG: cell division ATPase MinD [Candidatus Aenigmatarchaeota archaeon]|nr:cell division ATPase MinD [Nanoarchaeota archaeon]
MKRIICVVSGKGGVGKTVVTCNLGLALTELVGEVTVVDADLSVSNLGIQLGSYEPVIGLQEVLRGEVDVDDSISFHRSGLKFIPSSISNERRFTYKPYRLKNVLKDLNGIVLIDAPPGLGDDVFSALNSCSEVIVVTNPEIPAVTDAMKIVKFAKDMKKEVLGIVVNRRRSRFELKDDEIEDLCEAHVIANIPEDHHLRKSIHEKTPIVQYKPFSSSSLEFKRLAANLAGIKYKQPRFARLRMLF